MPEHILTPGGKFFEELNSLIIKAGFQPKGFTLSDFLKLSDHPQRWTWPETGPFLRVRPFQVLAVGCRQISSFETNLPHHFGQGWISWQICQEKKQSWEPPKILFRNIEKPTKDIWKKNTQIFFPPKSCPFVMHQLWHTKVVGQGVNSSRLDTTKLHSGRKDAIERGQPSAAESLGRRWSLLWSWSIRVHLAIVQFVFI